MIDKEFILLLQIFSTSKPGSGSPVAPSFTWPGIFWGGKGDRKIILRTRIIKELFNLSPDWADGSCPVSGAPSTASAIRGGLPKQAGAVTLILEMSHLHLSRLVTTTVTNRRKPFPSLDSGYPTSCET